MCILFIAVDQHPNYPLIIAANRDEFHQRPTQHSHYWPSNSALLAGKDLEAGGTWMGVSRNGKVSALTNIRNPHRIQKNAISRGALVTAFLEDQAIDEETYTQQLVSHASRYNGYNLLMGCMRRNHYAVFNNHTLQYQTLQKGYYGLSNASLDTPWPKIEHGKLALADYCETHSELNPDALFKLLSNQTKAADDALPDTGVPLQWERLLSSIFIQGEDYGTRTSTLLWLDRSGHVHWAERNFSADAIITDEHYYHFHLE